MGDWEDVVRGGQGRTSRDLVADASALIVLGIMTAAAALLAALVA